MIKSYKQHYLCEPVYAQSGHLRAVELLTAFTTPEGTPVSWNDVTEILTPEYKWLNFVRQLGCIRQHHAWLHRHGIAVSLNLDEETAHCLIRDEDVLALLSGMPCVRLEIHECFITSDLDRQGLLGRLCRHVALWLDDVGSGSLNNFDLLVKGYFSGAKMDKSFFWQHHNTGTGQLEKVIRDLTRFAGQVVVEGVETPEHLHSLSRSPHCWLQGYLFARSGMESLQRIPLMIPEVGPAASPLCFY
ncbi:TPA: EAL domain-containing protein [Salmonella enterica subsp. diarizonae serovar 61:l,v:z35]